MQVDEDLPKFYDITNLRQRNQMVTMYNNMKNNFGFEYTDPDTIEELQKAAYPTVTITGTPWYNVMSNPQYVNEFNFIPSYVQEREKIINDGYDEIDENSTEEQIKMKVEQSDLTMIFLQLAYIPDTVVQHVDFTKAGWSYEFKERMDQFKADFEKEHGKEWMFQNEFTEESY